MRKVLQRWKYEVTGRVALFLFRRCMGSVEALSDAGEWLYNYAVFAKAQTLPNADQAAATREG